ncbi:hypothetical protein [Halostella sp. PRR32]|uniref:hypothetical protein n=1 Tax=Halostella sp. PRR32 TaxID=3098147 RepID=UPI002B1E61F5|nr:hypothetical protein [Halostella sp. PRR32]
MDIAGAVFVTQSVLLFVTGALLVYPLVAYAQNVAYSEGFVFLSLGFLVFTATYILGTFGIGDFGVRSALHFLATTCMTVGIWSFASEFVTAETDAFEIVDTTTSGGFDRANDE